MFSIEKISSGSQQTLLLYLSFLGILLFSATLLRLKIPFLQRAFIPASLLAGLMGLVLGPYVLRIIPSDMMATIGGLPSNMIVIVFASMLLGLKKSGKPLKDSVKTVVPGVLQFYTYSFAQMGIGCLLCALFFTPLFGTNPLFGSTFEIGFAGGHGTAGGMVEVFQMLGWPEGGDVAKTTATIGLVAGIFGGMAIINFGVRKKYTRYLTKKMAAGAVQEYYPEGERASGASITISSDVVETFAFHAGLLGIAIFIGYEIVWIAKQLFHYSLPLFPFAMIGGWLLNPALAAAWGTLAAGALFTLLAAGLILFCFAAGFWVKRPKLAQRE